MNRKLVCPVCRKPSQEPHTPFCSSRCADVDLNRWLSEAYTIPVVEREEDMDSPTDAGEDRA